MNRTTQIYFKNLQSEEKEKQLSFNWIIAATKVKVEGLGLVKGGFIKF